MNHPDNRIAKINKNTENCVQALRGIFCPLSEPPDTTGMKNQWVNNKKNIIFKISFHMPGHSQ